MATKTENKKEKKYWLIKSEGTCYSIDDLKKDKVTPWTGIRNYQARNFMRDSMQIGDLVLFYHSVSDPTGVYGVAKVVSKPHIDESALDPKDEHFDPAAVKREKEIAAGGKTQKDHFWMLVDIAFVKKLKRVVSLHEMKLDPKLAGMVVLQKGSRLSVQPVSERHFTYIVDVLGKQG
jgi:predicted RNA-binding protein with PUA-like domain